MTDLEARRAWVVPPGRGRMNELELAYLDPADEDDRHFLILAEHPELWKAIESEADEGSLVSSGMPS